MIEGVVKILFSFLGAGFFFQGFNIWHVNEGRMFLEDATCCPLYLQLDLVQSYISLAITQVNCLFISIGTSTEMSVARPGSQCIAFSHRTIGVLLLQAA